VTTRAEVAKAIELLTSQASDFLDSAYSDGDPVTQNEFFRQASVVTGTHTYTRIARKLDQGCPDLTGVTATALAGQAPPPTAAPSTTADIARSL